MSYEINQKTCSRCRMCETVCPLGIIGHLSDKSVHFHADRIEICVQCGQCMAVCATESIQVADLKYGREIFEMQDHTIDYQLFMNFLYLRRSVRHFQNKPVPRELLEKIIDAVSTAPFGVNIGNVEFTIVNNRELIEKSVPIMQDKMKDLGKMMHGTFSRLMLKAILPLEVYNSVNNFIVPHIDLGLYSPDSEIDDIARNAPAMILFHAPTGAEEHTIDSHIYLTYCFLAAHSLGLGATVIGLIPPFINRDKELRKMFRIPDKNEVVISLIVGYPRIKYLKAIKRPRTKVHWIE